MKIIDSIILCIILIIYSPWMIMHGTFSSGDWPYLFTENIKAFSWFPEPRFLWLAPYYQILTKLLVEYFGLSWFLIERIVWFWPFVILSCVSAYLLTRSTIGALIYSTNAYALMLAGGGQMGVALSYSVAPLVLNRFIKSIDNIIFQTKNAKCQMSKITYWISSGLMLSIQIMLDPRIAMITLGAAILYGLFFQKYKSVSLMIVPIAGAILLNLYWIIPFLFGNKEFISHLGDATASAVKYLSFATFSQTLSLLHPNWPENIFGKIYFFKSEFLILPLLSFSSLLFLGNITRNKKQNEPAFSRVLFIQFFMLLAFLGIFLAKGAGEPFGFIYLWLFKHIPGFILFRDPTKFYFLIALSYSVLIPFSLSQLSELLKRQRIAAQGFAHLLPYAFLFFWIFIHREAVIGKLGGTFKPHSVPAEYIRLKDYLYNKPGFSRVLWLPLRQRYGFNSDERPGLSIDTIGGMSSSSFVSWIMKPDTEEQLMRLGVSDIVVPTDPLGELFITDRQYDDNKRKSIISALRAVSYLNEMSSFGEIVVFQTKKNYGHVYLTQTPLEGLFVQRISPVKYSVVLPRIDYPQNLMFSESYDPHWELEIGNEHISPMKTPDGFQEYRIQSFPGGHVNLIYRMQKYINYSFGVSGLICVIVIVVFINQSMMNKRYNRHVLNDK